MDHHFAFRLHHVEWDLEPMRAEGTEEVRLEKSSVRHADIECVRCGHSWAYGKRSVLSKRRLEPPHVLDIWFTCPGCRRQGYVDGKRLE